MTRNIDTYVPPMRLMHHLGGVFKPEDCDKIAQFGELFLHEQGGGLGRVGGGRNNEGKPVEGEVNEAIRKSPIAWIQPREDTFFMFERLNEVVAHVNFSPFQLDLVQFDGFQYSKYKAPGGHYHWHTDTTLDSPNGLYRKLSVVVALNDPDEYEGGDLLLNLRGDQEKPEVIRLKKGEAIFFYSHIPHTVTPVTKGVRCTLVTWCMGPKLC